MKRYRVRQVELVTQRVVIDVDANDAEEAAALASQRDGEIKEEEILEIRDVSEQEVEER